MRRSFKSLNNIFYGTFAIEGGGVVYRVEKSKPFDHSSTSTASANHNHHQPPVILSLLLHFAELFYISVSDGAADARWSALRNRKTLVKIRPGPTVGRRFLHHHHQHQQKTTTTQRSAFPTVSLRPGPGAPGSANSSFSFISHDHNS